MSFSKYYSFDASFRIFYESHATKHIVQIKKSWNLEIRFDTEAQRFLPTGYVLTRDYLQKHEDAINEFDKKLKHGSSRTYILRSAKELIEIITELNGCKTIIKELEKVVERHDLKMQPPTH
jgi:hypothetical protein